MPANRCHAAPGNIVALALLLTSVLLVTGVTISVVVTEGSARASEADQAVGAYYMANSGVEAQLFAIRKGGQTLAAVAAATSVNAYPGGASWVSTTGFDRTAVKHLMQILPEQFAFVDLFNPENISEMPNVANVRISWEAGSDCPGGRPPDMEVGYAQWQVAAGGISWPDASANYQVSIGTGGTMTIAGLNPSASYRLRVRPFVCHAANVDIQPLDSSMSAQTYLGDIRLGSEGTFGATTQKLTVIMPRQDILSNVFSYMVFSEQPLCKRVGTAGTCP